MDQLDEVMTEFLIDCYSNLELLDRDLLTLPLEPNLEAVSVRESATVALSDGLHPTRSSPTKGVAWGLPFAAMPSSEWAATFRPSQSRVKVVPSLFSLLADSSSRGSDQTDLSEGETL